MEVERWVAEHALLVAGGLLLLGQHRFGRLALYPLTLVTTWAHEVAHGLAAIAVGGRLERLRVYPDASGLAEVRVPPGRLAEGVVASAGYLGAAALGAAMLAARPLAGRDGLLLLGGALAVSTVLWVRNLTGVLLLPLVGAALGAAGWWLPPAWARVAYLVVALAIALNATQGLRSLFGRVGGRVGGQLRPTDAARVAELWLGPPWLWAALWLLSSLGLVAGGLWLGA